MFERLLGQVLSRLSDGPPIVPTRGPFRVLARYEALARAAVVPFRIWSEDFRASRDSWFLLIPALILYGAYRWRVERRALVTLGRAIEKSGELDGN